MSIFSFFKMSGPSEQKVPLEKQDKVYKSLRFQTFLAGTLGYSLYYVCRTGLNVVKGPIINEGFLTATQLGAISSCLLYSYAAGKFVNGILADRSNIKRFMAMGLLVSAFANLVFGFTGLWNTAVGAASSAMVLFLCFLWAMNGWVQSMGTAPAVVGLSRWFPLSIRGTYYGFFSSSHNIGEGLSFVFCGLLVGLAGWQWGFIGAAIAGVIGVIIIAFFMHDNPESKGLKQVELLTGEKTQEELDAEAAAKEASKADAAAETSKIQKAVFKNPGVWFLALASGFMYVARYAVNGWGDMGFWDKTDRFEYGVGFGGGLQIWRFQLSARYNWNFHDMLNADNGTYDSWYWAHPPMYMPENCNLDSVSHIKKFVNIPVVCAGRMDPETGAKAAILSGILAIK